jgi:hypothetical protein
MALTRKDFKILAEELSEAGIDDLRQLVGFMAAVDAVCRALKRINPRFDADRFRDAVEGSSSRGRV